MFSTVNHFLMLKPGRADMGRCKLKQEDQLKALKSIKLYESLYFKTLNSVLSVRKRRQQQTMEVIALPYA